MRMTYVAVASCLAMTDRAALPPHSVHPFAQGRTLPVVVGAGGIGAAGRDAGPGTYHRPGLGAVSAFGVL